MPEPINTRFTIRVYGIILNENEEVLLSDESYMGHRFTKFPGGGLEYGEGTIDCLKREMREETGCEVEVIDPVGIVCEFVSHHRTEIQRCGVWSLLIASDCTCISYFLTQSKGL